MVMDARGPIMHTGENRKSSNADAIGIEMEVDRTETPVGIEFARLERAINSLDSSIMVLIKQLQPALGPSYPENTETNDVAAKSEKRSIIVEELARHRVRVLELSDLVERISTRVEL